MSRAAYPGSFDPVTYGHLDIIERASAQFDEVVIGVLNNAQKTPLFSVEERVKLLKAVTKDIPNVVIRDFSGLSVNFARTCGAKVIIRGLRAMTDFEYELHMAQTNRILAPDIDTMFLITSLEYAYLSSTTVREIAALGEDLTPFIPAVVAEELKRKFQQ